VKKLFACLFAIIILAINVMPCFAAGPALSISSNDYTVSAGDTITVTVALSANSNLGTLTFNVKYNTAEFEYVSSAEGGLFENEIVNVVTAGVVRYAGISTGVVTNGGALVTFKFKSVANGGKISASVVEATDENDVSVRVSGSSITMSCNHARLVWQETTAATCKKAGKETGTCPCGYTTTRETEKAAHTYTSSTVKKPATCTATGIEVGTCTVCGASGAESKIPAKGHNYSEWEVKQPATADAMGIKERFCLNCGETKTQMIPALIEGISPEDITDVEENSTETTTEFEPIYTPEPSTDHYFEIETETTTQPNGIFGNAVGSDIAIIAVIALAALVVVVLVLYILLIIRQKKK
jgi:hypothetical protein